MKRTNMTLILSLIGHLIRSSKQSLKDVEDLKRDLEEERALIFLAPRIAPQLQQHNSNSSSNLKYKSQLILYYLLRDREEGHLKSSNSLSIKQISRVCLISIALKGKFSEQQFLQQLGATVRRLLLNRHHHYKLSHRLHRLFNSKTLLPSIKSQMVKST